MLHHTLHIVGGQPDIEGLKQFYLSNLTARAFLDHCARRANNQKETMVGRILTVLQADGHDVQRRDIIELFRKLASFACGEFRVGRGSKQTRFVWGDGVEMASVGRAVAGEPPKIEQTQDEKPAEETTEAILTASPQLPPERNVISESPTDVTDGAGKKLREARIKVGLSQAELAEKIGVQQPTISDWERGLATPSEDLRKRLDRILGAEAGEEEGIDVSPLAAWLSKARLTKKWSVPELAHKAGLTAAAIYRIESGITRNLRETTKKKIEKALGTPMPVETEQELAEEAEIVGLGKLEDFDPHNTSERPEGPGIYVLYDVSERPGYVGQGQSVKKRIEDHDDKFWFKRPIVESASWILVKDQELRLQIETLLIKFLKSNAVLNKKNVER